MVHISRRTALTIVAGAGVAVAARRADAADTSGRVIYPVAVPVYQTQFIADRIGYFKEAGLDCKLIQGGSGVKTREIIASSQGDIGIGDITHPMQLSNHGRAGRVLMPVDTRSSSVMFIIRKDLKDQGINTLEDYLGLIAGRHQSRLGVLLHGNHGARSESDVDRHRQCRYHAGVAEIEAGRHSHQLSFTVE